MTNKNIDILGFAFKANTNDTRESPAIQICKNLFEEGAILKIHDPKVSKKQIGLDLGVPASDELIKNPDFNELNIEKHWDKYQLSDDLFDQADAVIILTEWDIYSKLNWENISKRMRSPAWVFDSRLVIDKQKVIDSGLNLWRLGDGTIN